MYGHRRAAGVWVAAGILAALLAGCGNSADNSSGAPIPGAAPGEADMSKADTAAGEAAAPPAGAPVDQQPGTNQQAPTKVDPQPRSIVYNGSMSVQVDDVNKAANSAGDMATAAGGSVSADKRSLDGDNSEAQVTLRVPADAFNATLNKLATLGTEEARSITTQDVTETLIDLDARLATQRASVDRVRALLAKANTVGEVVAIESELTRREADLASLEQRKEKLSGLVSLSTITLSLRGPSAPGVPTEPETGFLAGLKSGWAAFLDSVKVVLTIAGWLLPFAILIGVPLWLVLALLRRRRTPARPAPSLPTPPPTDA